ncbi:hypothetical protein AAC387_Pa09g2071 [Persea americana]
MGRHLPSGNTARPDRYGRSFMAIGLLIYGDKRCALSSLYASRLKAWKVSLAPSVGILNKKLANTMPPKTRNCEGPSKGKASSIQPTLAQNLPPPPPQQRRSGGRSPTVQTLSQSRGVTMPSLRDVPPPEQPHHSHRRTVQGEKSVTKPPEKSARARSQSHHQASLEHNEDPRLADIKAQNLLIQEQRELIERLTQQLEGKKDQSPPPRRPGHGQDLRHVLNSKRRDRDQREEGSSSSHIHEGPKKQCQGLEDDELKKWIDQQVKQTLRQNMEAAGLDRDQYATFEAEDTGASPFSREIRRYTLPEKFSVPRFTLYDGTSDPAAHLRHYIQRMSVWGDDDSLNCRVFSSILADLPLRWFCSLPEESISSWRQLRASFLGKFQAHRVIPKTDADLMALRMQENENVTQFARRFWTVYSQIESASEELAVRSFQLALQPGTLLRAQLVMYPVTTMKELMTRANRFILAEEDEARGRENFGLTKKSQPAKGDNRPSRREDRRRDPSPDRRKARSSEQRRTPSASTSGSRGSRRSGHEPTSHVAVNTIFKEPIYRLLNKIKAQPFFKWPRPMVADPSSRDQTRFCAYHKQNGHRTDECKSFKFHLEDLVKEGHLREYIKQEGRGDGRPPRREADNQDSEPEGVIHVIHLAAPPKKSSQARAEARRASHQKQVLTAAPEPSAKKAKTEGVRIWFSDKDLEDVELPHNDALVLTLKLQNFLVQRALVDPGSSSEVLYYDCFKKLGLKDEDLQACRTPLVGFSSKPVYPKGRISLRVQVGGACRQVDFLVVDVPSPYNVIMGRTWLHSMEAVPSTRHQKLKFPLENRSGRAEVITVKGDQHMARQCLLAVLSDEAGPSQVNVTELDREAELEDVGRAPAQKSIEDLTKVNIDPADPDRFFLVGSQLPETEKIELLNLLEENKAVFAWTPYEMPGIDPAVICHELKVDPNHKPVLQKPRRTGIPQAEAVAEEVQKLLEAGAIREVHYPQWLANTVVVKKKTGKWRVCVDFTDLNKACPKDSFPLPKIDQLIDATAGHDRMSFLDAYRGYHQIPMYAADQEKTAFITPRGTYCYKVMPFGLKNAGATYQRLVTKMFQAQLGKTVEVYIDDMVVKSKRSQDHLTDLRQIFDILRQFQLKLNASKCAFGVGSGKFLGSLVTRRGIEANPDQITAIQDLRCPTSAKQVQRLTGMAAALNRFISRASDKCRPFFQLLRKGSKFQWTAECSQALQQLKQYLSSPPLLSTPTFGEPLFLYLSVSDHAVSSVLIREDNGQQRPIYYTSKTLLDAETRYLQLEKLALALVSASRKLSHYFQTFTIVVVTEYPLKALLRKADFSGRISKWAVELGQYDIGYQPRTAIKAQVLADFIVEFTPQSSAPTALDTELGDDKGTEVITEMNSGELALAWFSSLPRASSSSKL